MTSDDNNQAQLPGRPLSVAEVAAWFGYEEKAVLRLIKHKDPKKRLEATKVGGQWRIWPSAVIALMEKEIEP